MAKVKNINIESVEDGRLVANRIVPGTDLPAERPSAFRACVSALGSVYAGYSTLNLYPSNGLHRFRCELEDYSEHAVSGAWKSTARALAAVTGAELDLHGVSQLDTPQGEITAIRGRAHESWDQPGRENSQTMRTPTDDVDVVLQKTDGTTVLVTLKGMGTPATTRIKIYEALKTMVAETETPNR